MNLSLLTGRPPLAPRPRLGICKYTGQRGHTWSGMAAFCRAAQALPCRVCQGALPMTQMPKTQAVARRQQGAVTYAASVYAYPQAVLNTRNCMCSLHTYMCHTQLWVHITDRPSPTKISLTSVHISFTFSSIMLQCLSKAFTRPSSLWLLRQLISTWFDCTGVNNTQAQTHTRQNHQPLISGGMDRLANSRQYPCCTTKTCKPLLGIA